MKNAGSDRGQAPPSGGRVGHFSNGLPASATISEASLRSYLSDMGRPSSTTNSDAALRSYLSNYQGQLEKFTREQLRQVQKAIAAEEGILERAMANAPAYTPPPQTITLARGNIWPVANGGGHVSQEFGPTDWAIYAGRTYNGVYYPHFHTGIDIAAPMGTPLVAFDAGRVIYAGGTQQSGVGVVVQHDNGSCTTYHHMGLGAAGPTVQVGQYVSAGQTLGHIGMTGMTTGPHMHFMVKYADLINPRQVLPSR